MTFHQKPIDVAKEIDRPDQQILQGERDASELKSAHHRFLPNSKIFLRLLIIVACSLGGFIVYKVSKNKESPQVTSVKSLIRNILPQLNIISEKPLQPTENLSPSTDDHSISEEPETTEIEAPQEISPEERLHQRRLNSGLTDKSSEDPQMTSASFENQTQEKTSENNQENDLQKRMKPLRLEASMAGQLSDRHYLLTQGSMIDCVLQTRMITTQPGMTSCYVTRPIYSANGRVILLERGSKVIGHYQGGITQGQARIFVLWSRIETPHGIIINLDSPGTGTLGEGGIGGYVDTHFWERFGGAILLSLIDDFSTAATQRMTQSNNKGQISFSNTADAAQDMAAEALRNSINIPPTLYKNQGERIAIFVARDLDFRTVYDLKSR